MTAVEPGEPVGIVGEHGYYRVTAIHEDHVELYGGDKDPNGRRQFRAVTVDRLRRLTGAQRREAGFDR